MRVMSQSPDPLARMHTMTKRQGKSGTIDVKAVLGEDEEFLRALVRTALQEVLEAEMTEALSAEKGERAAGRQGYRSGYYGRTLITRVGKLETGEQPAPSGVMVKSQIIKANGEPVKVDYMMRRNGEGWLISDISISTARSVRWRPGAPNALSILETEDIGPLSTALSAKSSF